MKKKGVKIEDYIIRRDSDFRKYLEEVNAKSDEKIYSDVVTFANLNIETFLCKNNTPDKLKKALTLRDHYYANIAVKAADIIANNKALKEKLAKQEELIKKLQLESESINVKDLLNEIKDKNNAIKTLKRILDTYVYPSVANTLLSKEGILEVVAGVVDDETVDNLMINANTDMSNFITANTNNKDVSPNDYIGKKVSKYDSVNKLAKGFDE